ncbi:hypothetical protein ACSSZE_10075 [Acidithiobacillus caldus]
MVNIAIDGSLLEGASTGGVLGGLDPHFNSQTGDWSCLARGESSGGVWRPPHGRRDGERVIIFVATGNSMITKEKNFLDEVMSLSHRVDNIEYLRFEALQLTHTVILAGSGGVTGVL